MTAWLRLDLDYADDAAIDSAGWEACAIWPRILCLLKQSKGAVSDHQLSPRYLSRRMADMPEDVVEVGVSALKRVGLLLPGRCVYLGPGGRDVEVSGWVTLNLAEKGNGPTASAVVESLDVSNGDQVGPSSPTSHAGAVSRPVASCPVSSEKRAISDGVARLWEKYVEHQAAVGIKRRSEKPTADVAPGLRARLVESGEDAVEAVIRWAHTSDHDRAKHLRETKALGETLFRKSKFPQYLAFAESPDSNGSSRQGGIDFEAIAAEVNARRSP